MLSFEASDLSAQMENLEPEQFDALPFGAIKLDENGRVVAFNEAERILSGYGSRPTIGKVFFTEIAPCMDDPEFRGRIDAARERGTLNLQFAWIGDFADASRQVKVRVHSASDGGVWIFIQRPAAPVS